MIRSVTHWACDPAAGASYCAIHMDACAKIPYSNGMYELPLFPLNTVLFPGMPISLHIFEDRYKQMMNLCIEERRPFGVLLIAEGEEARGPVALPHLVGCTAAIQQVEELPQGRMNMVAIGADRFRLLELKHDKPYLVGVVETYALDDEAAPTVAAEFAALQPLVADYLGILARVGDVDIDIAELPVAPVALGFLSAALLRVGLEEKQGLLESSTTVGMLRRLRRLYSQEVALLRLIPPDNQGAFSVN